VSPSQTGAPAFPHVLPAIVPSVTLVNFTTMDRDIQNARSRQVGVEVERRLGANATISVGFDHLSGRGLIAQINRNAPACAVAGGNNGCRPNPAYANHNQYESAGRSTYNGLRVSWLQRPAAWGSYRVSYTLSTSMNNVGEAFFNGPIDPGNIESDWGPSDDDQRHRLIVSATVHAPYELQVTPVVQYYSGVPFTVTSGVTTVFGTTGRPLVDDEFIGRNTGRRAPFSSVGLRVARTFAVTSGVRVEALIEGFNLFNRANETARNVTFGTGAYPIDPLPSFGRVTGVGEPRTFQVGLRARF
jgi:hypothetical protein